MQELKSENSVLLLTALILVILGSFLVLGLAGARTMSGIIIVIFLPFYLIFDNFGLSYGEKIAFSFFTGITLFPSFAYWLGFVVPFRISILAVFTALMAAGFLLRKFCKRQTILEDKSY